MDANDSNEWRNIIKAYIRYVRLKTGDDFIYSLMPGEVMKITDRQMGILTDIANELADEA